MNNLPLNRLAGRHVYALRAVTLEKAFLLLCLLSVAQILNPWSYVLAVGTLGLLLTVRKHPINVSMVLIAVFAAVGAFVAQIFTPSIYLAAKAIPVAAFIFALGAIGSSRWKSAFTAMSVLTSFAVVSSIVGFVYALAGGPSFGTVVNPDGREALIYLGTISNAVFPAGVGSLIRPSFIFDEPGSFAFVVDVVLICNYLLCGRLRSTHWVLLIGGLVTFSAAHFFVCVMLLIAERRARILLISVTSLLALDYLLLMVSDVSLVAARFAVVDGALGGTTRFELLDTASRLALQFPLGIGSTCAWDMPTCASIYGGFGENPAFPAAYYGLPISVPYYVFMISLIAMAISNPRRKYAPAVLALWVTCAQRPFLFELGYNLLFVLSFSICAMMWRFEPLKSRFKPNFRVESVAH